MVNGFSGGQLELTDAAAPPLGGKRTIAKLENTFQVGVGPKKFNPSRSAAARHLTQFIAGSVVIPGCGTLTVINTACRFLPTQDAPEANADRFELAGPEVAQEEVHCLLFAALHILTAALLGYQVLAIHLSRRRRLP